MKRIIGGQYNEEVSSLEKRNRETAYRAALESFVLLRNDGGLPLQGKEIALFGAGATHTIKGGTGSGEVNNRHSVTIYEGLKDAGFMISSEAFLERYIREEAEAHAKWIKDNTKMPSANSLAENYKLINPAKITEEDLKGLDGHTAIYVVSRQSGEAADKKIAEGDYTLQENETDDIHLLAQHFEHLVVIVNSGSSIDLSAIEDLSCSLVYFGQAGQEGGKALADVLSGKENFCGKLTTSWAKKYEDIPFGDEFSYLNGDLANEYYKEDIYVGYRYFDTFKVEPRFRFGYGLSYTDFSLECVNAEVTGRKLELTVKVTNTGAVSGKEIVEVYASCPEGRLEKEYQRLFAFRKTKKLEAGESEEVRISADLYGLASYDEANASYLLEKGDYLIRVGKDSADTETVLRIRNEEDIVLSKHDNVFKADAEYEKLHAPKREEETADVPVAILNRDAFSLETYTYGKPAVYSDERVDAILDQLNDRELIDVCTGIGTLGMMDTNVFCSPGIAGKTTYKLLNKGLLSVNLADGPGGLRLVRKTAVSKKGGIRMFKGNYLLSFMETMPDWALFFVKPGKKDTVFYQFATAFPVGTNLAQTWNEALVEEVGRAVSEEMDRFNVTYWLAPGMNIQRNPLCGRNFEYYSEDPLVSGKISAAMTRGVQSIEGNYTTIKHFACNNAEDNREHSNSHVSERALREIYLKGFEINVKEAHSRSLMTSYNMINGVYSPDSYDLCTKVLRNEWGFDGVVMTDWFSTRPGQGHSDLAVANGNDMIMPGDKVYEKTLEKGLKEGNVTHEDLKRAAANIIRSVVDSRVAQKYRTEDFL